MQFAEQNQIPIARDKRGEAPFSVDANLLHSSSEGLSLGIGHFIWYPAGKKGPFEESFAEFLVYLEEKNKQLPAWLTEGPESHCPWKDRLDFMRDSGSVRALDLRKFLLETKTEQIAFLIKRLQEALPTMVKNVPEADREQITRQFYRMARTPAGVYALVDYINFKGLGVVPTERYRGQGWGLAQVLGGMTGEEDGVAALEEFVRTAEGLLTERVNNAPVERNEVRWLPGWKNRVNSYLDVQETKTPRG